ncbi:MULTISPECIES: type IV pilus secretin PilQ [Comamonas]|jgi:type IV pilus assembly protein PilQ|uniref:type IV pilus secretin PilQ n=1 Tax=Comamonas TaxID=283 RepID=UPI00284E91F2|nr:MULTISPECIES: type IV pilus secretin PilQ [Comamonas]MDR3067425.1 type IV pilus secretin PilQ [Comamonas sp.]MEB5965865.1 type IV pilus secretin PilQ [Comamonas testosteroni]
MMGLNRSTMARARWGLALSGLLLSSAAWAQVRIESVTGALQSGSEVVRVEMSEPLAADPSGFVVQSPARIALDFPGVSNGSGKSLVEFNQGNLRSANLVEASGRSRLVLNLKTATTYRLQREGKALLILLDPAGAAASATAAAAAMAPVFESKTAPSDTAPIRAIDFRRGSDGSGRIVVSLGSSQVGVDLRQEGKGLTVDFLRTALPENLRRKLDVGDFGTPVQTISTTQQGDRVRMRIDPVGDWEHSAYQSDNQFVVEVRQKKIDTSKLTQGPGYSGEKLSLNFQNIEVRSLLQVIADFTNFNIVTSDTVSGALTLRLKDVPWDQALQIIMDAKGLGMRKSGSVLWIAPKDEIDARTKRDYEAAMEIQKLEPLRTQGFQLNYAKAADILQQITTSTGGGGTGASTRFLSSRGSAISEPRTNQLFVTDTPTKLDEMKALLVKLDVPVRQVMIEARIVEARDTFGRSLGVKFGGGAVGSNASMTSSQFLPDSSSGGNSKFPSGNFVNLPASVAGVNTVGQVAFSVFNSSMTRFLSLELSALEAEGDGKIISNPRLVTADQNKALIEQGTEYPYSVTAPNGATTIAFKKAVLKLEVTPQITPEGDIILDLDVNKDSRGETTTQGVAIDTKHIKTQVLVENGGTVVIGGIFEMEETNQLNKVPLFGDLPVLGHLFRNTSKASTKREMLVFITPKMLNQVRSTGR